MKTALDHPVTIIGTGFLRAAILRRIATARPGATVRVLSTVPPAPVADLSIEHVNGPLTDLQAVYAAISGADSIIHLGTGDAEVYGPNASGTATITSAAISQNCRHVLFCSLPDVYGDGAGRLLDENDPLIPQTRLARAKVIGERLVEQFSMIPGRSSTVIRPFGLYGPGQPAESTMGRVLTAAATGHPVILPGGGTQLRNFTYCDDVAAGIVAALCRDNTDTAPHACYNIASCETYSLRDAAKLAIKLIGSTSTIAAPSPARRRSGRVRPVTVQIPSVERAARELGFHATTLLAEGISRCVLHDHAAAVMPDLVTA
ncbi:NAD-dependent epimerase/dehydratase family protein [Nonomuraea jiangxiensis]|uniref:Nucleoside-diphosphate-sugar epimerase n=1 Tax=Nonomuraea jiangxiensis TaxID=633440 RepID=A0A1G9CPT3_9ACTN|nr:NAD(P)-dependent oxidoreductase [Nonomuraea jiangxiensis]SDK53733.1 Nucleoside-diphosphate-sugar epimerase [Nonomuraea jiangxiensis]